MLSSDRLRASVDNLPWRYAVQDEYYRRLLNGQLGFQLVFDAETRPSFLGLRFDDSGSDESFTVYDHPHVRIFKKVEKLDAAAIHDRLLWGINQPWSPTRTPPRKQLIYGAPVETITTTDDASWNTFAVEHSWFAILAWLLAVEAVGLAALPLTARVLRRAPDHGVLSTRVLGLLLVGWVGWFAASAGLWGSTALHIALALAALCGVSWGYAWWCRRRGNALDLPSPRAYLRWSSIWLGLFALFLLFRAIYPDFWQTYFGGEKPFEIAYLRAVSRSVSFPPYDPWFADGTINYYYDGWHLVSSLIKLSGVGVSLGFQFGSATFAALFGCQVVGLTSLLTGRGRRRLPVRRLAAVGLLGLVAVEFVGNLDAFKQVLRLNGSVTASFDFWQSTRVIAYTIDEFPYFSELWADLHPHVINFALFALLLTLVSHLALEARLPGVSLRSAAPLAAATALTLGSVAVTNSWDAPLSIGLVLLAAAYVRLTRSVRAALAGGVLGAVTVIASFALFWPFYRGFYSVVRGVHRASHGSNLGQFLTVWGIFYAIVALAIVGVLLTRRAPLADPRDATLFFVIAGVVASFAMLGAWVLDALGAPRQTALAELIGVGLITAAATAWQPLRLRPVVLGGVVALTCVSVVVGPYRPAATVALAFATAGTLAALNVWRRPSAALPWAFVTIASVVVAATEFIYVADDLQHSPWERMNTVFKFYLQAWTLLAVAATLLLWQLLRVAVRGRTWSWPTPAASFIAQSPARPSMSVSNERRRAGALLCGWVGVGALALGLVYPVAATPARFDRDMPSSPSGLSLDGYAWMQGGQITTAHGQVITFTDDLAVIRWLDAHVHGTPTYP